MKRVFFIAILSVALCGCDKSTTLVDDGKPQGGDLYVESFDTAIEGDNQYLYGYVGEHLQFEHFYQIVDEGYSYWGGFAQSKLFDTDLANGILENQYAAYNSSAASGDGFLLYYYDSYNEPCDILFRRAKVYRFQSVKLNLTTYTYASIVDEGINDFARVFGDGDYLKVVFTPIDRDMQPVDSQRVECYIVDYRDGRRFVADSWNEFELDAIEGSYYGVRVVIETTDVGDYGANTPLYICMDDLKYSLVM